MKRLSVFALLGMIAVAGGCASPAHYIDHQKPDSGIVAIPDNSNVWPNYNMKAAKQLIQQHVGPNYEIVDQYQFKTPQMLNKRNPNETAERQTTTGVATTQDTTEWRIVYRRVAAPQPIAGYPTNQGAVNGSGLTQAGGITAQGPPPGTVPSVLPAFR